jgi:hypothetical protein
MNVNSHCSQTTTPAASDQAAGFGWCPIAEETLCDASGLRLIVSFRLLHAPPNSERSAHTAYQDLLLRHMRREVADCPQVRAYRELRQLHKQVTADLFALRRAAEAMNKESKRAPSEDHGTVAVPAVNGESCVSQLDEWQDELLAELKQLRQQLQQARKQALNEAADGAAVAKGEADRVLDQQAKDLGNRLVALVAPVLSELATIGMMRVPPAGYFEGEVSARVLSRLLDEPCVVPEVALLQNP